ncbi:MAG: type VI secretion system protein TssA, partial [Pseudomonas graminis]
MSLQTLIATTLGERDAVGLAKAQAEHWTAWLAPISAESAVG